MFRSITVKFNLVNCAAITTMLIFFGGYNFFEKKKALNQQLDKKIEASIARLQTSLPGAIWNYEEEQMDKIADSELIMDFLKGIFIYDNKQMLVGKIREENGSARAIDNVPAWDNSINQKLIFNDGSSDNDVGKVILLIDDSAFESILNSTLIALVLQTIFMLLILNVTSYFLMNKIVLSSIVAIRDSLDDMASGDGDLTKRLKVTTNDEVGELSTNFNALVEKIHSTIKQVIDSVDSMHSASTDIQSVAEQTTDRAASQKKETEVAATSMNEMSATAAEVAKSSASAATAANQANTDSREAIKVLDNAVAAINLLSSKIDSGSQVVNEVDNDVNEITSVLAVIRGIAEQTNLLALNAAIESARAGEQGRGFAVVADEVRALAGKTQECTEEIQDMISKLQGGTKHAVQAMEASKQQEATTVELINEVNESINHIVEAIATINDTNTQIASASEEQTVVTDEIQENLNRISSQATETLDAAENSQQLSAKLYDLGEELRKKVDQFIV